jgi:hypothetical protein
MSFYKYLEKEELQYLAVNCISKDQNIIKWFIQNFPAKIKSMISFDGLHYRQAFIVDKMETWEQTKEFINKAKAVYDGLMVAISPMYKTVSK